MDWDLVWAPREDGLLQAERETGKTPSALYNRPKLHEWLIWIFDAFNACSHGRAVYQGAVGYIPLAEILAYCELAGIEGTGTRQRLIRMLSRLDSVFVTHMNTQMKRDIEQSRRKAEAERGTRRGR